MLLLIKLYFHTHVAASTWRASCLGLRMTDSLCRSLQNKQENLERCVSSPGQERSQENMGENQKVPRGNCGKP